MKLESKYTIIHIILIGRISYKLLLWFNQNKKQLLSLETTVVLNYRFLSKAFITYRGHVPTSIPICDFGKWFSRGYLGSVNYTSIHFGMISWRDYYQNSLRIMKKSILDLGRKGTNDFILSILLRNRLSCRKKMEYYETVRSTGP